MYWSPSLKCQQPRISCERFCEWNAGTIRCRQVPGCCLWGSGSKKWIWKSGAESAFPLDSEADVGSKKISSHLRQASFMFDLAIVQNLERQGQVPVLRHCVHTLLIRFPIQTSWVEKSVVWEPGSFPTHEWVQFFWWQGRRNVLCQQRWRPLEQRHNVWLYFCTFFQRMGFRHSRDRKPVYINGGAMADSEAAARGRCIEDPEWCTSAAQHRQERSRITWTHSAPVTPSTTQQQCPTQGRAATCYQAKSQAGSDRTAGKHEAVGVQDQASQQAAES